MLPEISSVKGIHPGAILKRALRKNGWKSNVLAENIGEHKQTISSILNERRGINPGLSIKLAEQFEVAEDYFMQLQACYEVKKELEKALDNQKKPNLSNIREVLFWDTNPAKLDWKKDKTAIIKRIFERGNEKEREEIVAFYGKEVVRSVLKKIKNNFLPSFQDNVERFMNEIADSNG